MVESSWWERFRAWLAYLIFPEPNDWYVEACENANKLEAENETLSGLLEKAERYISNVEGGLSKEDALLTGEDKSSD